MTLFRENIKLQPSTMKLIGHNDSPVKNLLSIIVFLYHGNEKNKDQCEVADNSGHMILGRDQALRMKYVDLPQIPSANSQYETSENNQTVQEEEEKAATEPARPVIQHSTESSITITGRTHQLPTTKGYLLKEYVDVLKE